MTSLLFTYARAFPENFHFHLYDIVALNIGQSKLIVGFGIGFSAEAIACLEQAAAIFLEIGRLNMAARYYKVNFVPSHIKFSQMHNPFPILLCIFLLISTYPIALVSNM